MACSAPEYEIWDTDLPWHGLAGSDWTRRCDPRRVVADLADGMDVVVAHSYSAGLLLAAMAAGEARVGAAVLVSPFHRAEAKSFDWPTISSALNDFHQVFVEALRVNCAHRFSAVHREWLGRQLRDRVGPYGWMSFFELYLRSPFLRLDEVRTPVLVLRGADDAASRPEDSHELARGLPNARLAHLDGCGHFPMIEQPEQFARAVGRFLGSLDLVTAAVPADHANRS